MNRGSGMKDREEWSMGMETPITETSFGLSQTDHIRTVDTCEF